MEKGERIEWYKEQIRLYSKRSIRWRYPSSAIKAYLDEIGQLELGDKNGKRRRDGKRNS